VSYQNSIVPRLDTIEHSLEILGKLTPDMKQKLDAARTGPDALETAMNAALGALESASLSLASYVSEMVRCLAVYVEAVERASTETRVHMGIPYAMARAAYRLTEDERKRMARGDEG
jgi:hypothetical protein